MGAVRRRWSRRLPTPTATSARCSRTRPTSCAPSCGSSPSPSSRADRTKRGQAVFRLQIAAFSVRACPLFVPMLPSMRLSFAPAALLLACAPVRMPPSSPSALLGRPAPDLRSRAVAGAAPDAASLSGKVVVLDFFAEYCVPCRPRLALSERLRRELPEAVFLGISLDETAE